MVFKRVSFIFYYWNAPFDFTNIENKKNILFTTSKEITLIYPLNSYDIYRRMIVIDFLIHI